MSTAIEWTDASWNPVTGCSKVSPGCAHCYAERVAIRLWPSQYPPVEIPYAHRPVVNECPELDPDCQSNDDECHDGCEGPTRARVFTDVQCHEDRLDQPLRWKKPRKVFVNSMSDLFHEDVPDAFIDRVFAVMALAPQHTFQILTKRAERMRDYTAGLGRSFSRLQVACPEGWSLVFEGIPLAAWPLPNVWLGVSVENQHFADERIPLLLQTPAAIRFISAEPLLAQVSLDRFTCGECGKSHGSMASTKAMKSCSPCCLHCDEHGGPRNTYWLGNSPSARAELREGLNWVIVGGESGTGARPFDVAWARAIVQQCQAAGVPVFVKQLGGVPVIDEAEWRAAQPTRILSATNHRRAPAGTVAIACDDRKGGDMAEWPDDLRVREFPR